MSCGLILEVEESNQDFQLEFEEKIEMHTRDIQPLRITENGEYDGGEAVAYSPVTVEVASIQRLINATKSASQLFVGSYNASDSPDNLKIIQLLEGLDTTAVQNMGSMFELLYPLTTVPLFNTSNVKSMSSMFRQCPLLTEVPLFDTANVENMGYMFYGCASLTKVPPFDTAKVKNMSSMFYGCHSLTEIPPFDTVNVDNASYMFSHCTKLSVIPNFDFSKVTSLIQTFYNCQALTECWIRNIKCNIQIGSGTSWGHLLTVESLIHLIKELRDTGTLLTFTVGSENLKKLANVYVKPVEITDEMRANDDLIDEKLPFEVCESTDEGASLIVDYARFKNWTIQ